MCLYNDFGDNYNNIRSAQITPTAAIPLSRPPAVMQDAIGDHNPLM